MKHSKNKILIKKYFVTEDEVYLRLEDSGIPIIHIILDGISMATFEEDRHMKHYIAVKDCIKYYIGELSIYKGRNKDMENILNGNINFLKELYIKADPGLKHNGEIFDRALEEELKNG